MSNEKLHVAIWQGNADLPDSRSMVFGDKTLAMIWLTSNLLSCWPDFFLVDEKDEGFVKISPTYMYNSTHGRSELTFQRII